MKIRRIIIVSLFSALLISTSTYGQLSPPAWKAKDLNSYIAKSDSVLVINFWATFCKPCVGEIPYYQTVSNKYKDKVKLMLVSLDMKESYPDKIIAFAAKHDFVSQIIWLNETDADYFCPLINKNWSGALPTTYFINKKSGYYKLIEQQLSEKDFETELLKALGTK